MKLERMNEQQIRCTITSEDLKARQIKISELAYGTDKARTLFRDMMIAAENELDFEAGDEPLMIEATPINSECIILTVTKVDDPEELDTRFARFAPDLIEDKYDEDVSSSDQSLFSGISELADSLFAKGKEKAAASGKPAPPENVEDLHLVRLFSFKAMDDLIGLAHVIAADYSGDNSIYKDIKNDRYLLLMDQGKMDLMTFNRICNITSEYGESEKNLSATQAYLEEHCECIIASDAIGQLSKI